MPVNSRVCLMAGGAVLAAAWLGPLMGPPIASFTLHMAVHMALVAVAAPLLALGLAGGRYDPVVRRPSAFAAIPASVIELVAVWVWHAPQLHHAARHGTAAFALEQASFLGAGMYFWLSIVGGTPARRTAEAGSAVIALVLTFSHMTLLGALMVISTRPLYDHGDPAAVAAQHAGGALMLVTGGIVYIGAGLAIGRTLARAPRVEWES